jgi:hypothetical protein
MQLGERQRRLGDRQQGDAWPPNNGLQRTALRAAAEPGRSADNRLFIDFSSLAFLIFRRHRIVPPRLPKADVSLTPREVYYLLGDLCVKLGFCLPPEVNEALVAQPPTDVDRFAEAVFRAEGFNPVTGDRHLYDEVRAVVAGAFVRAEERAAEEARRLPQN